MEKNIGKWWGGESKRIFVIKSISIIIMNTLFILIKYYLPYLFNNYEFNFVLGSLLNFLQYFCLFGVIPLFLEQMELIEKRKLKKEGSLKIKNEEDDSVILFKTSIFRQEKQKENDEGFVILDKEIKKKSELKEVKKEEEIENIINNEIKNENENGKIILSEDENEENEIIYDKNKEEKEEIYSPSPLVENVPKFEDDEEEYNFVFEGINSNNKED